MNLLKIKTKISCNTCGCTLNRSKTIKVSAKSEEEAKKEASEKVKQWKDSLKSKNCKVCESIIKEMAA